MLENGQDGSKGVILEMSTAFSLGEMSPKVHAGPCVHSSSSCLTSAAAFGCRLRGRHLKAMHCSGAEEAETTRLTSCTATLLVRVPPPTPAIHFLGRW